MTNTNENKLLPCPFCGGSEDLNKYEDGAGSYYIACDNCEACGPQEYGEKDFEEMWNTRNILPLPAFKKMVEALEFYAHTNNHKLWDGEIMKLDKGKKAKEALEEAKKAGVV